MCRCHALRARACRGGLRARRAALAVRGQGQASQCRGDWGACAKGRAHSPAEGGGGAPPRPQLPRTRRLRACTRIKMWCTHPRAPPRASAARRAARAARAALAGARLRARAAALRGEARAPEGRALANHSRETHGNPTAKTPLRGASACPLGTDISAAPGPAPRAAHRAQAAEEPGAPRGSAARRRAGRGRGGAGAGRGIGMQCGAEERARKGAAIAGAVHSGEGARGRRHRAAPCRARARRGPPAAGPPAAMLQRPSGR